MKVGGGDHVWFPVTESGYLKERCSAVTWLNVLRSPVRLHAARAAATMGAPVAEPVREPVLARFPRVHRARAAAMWLHRSTVVPCQESPGEPDGAKFSPGLSVVAGNCR